MATNSCPCGHHGDPVSTATPTWAPAMVTKHCRVNEEGKRLLRLAVQRLGLSARAYHRVLKLARTIADLADVEAIAPAHVAESIQYRQLDRPLSKI